MAALFVSLPVRSFLAFHDTLQHRHDLGGRAARVAQQGGDTSELDKKGEGDLKIDFAVKALAETFADENGNFEMDGAEKRNASNLAAAVSKALPPDPKKKDPVEMRAFVVADAEALPCADGACDAVLSTFGAMFAPDAARAQRRGQPRGALVELAVAQAGLAATEGRALGHGAGDDLEQVGQVEGAQAGHRRAF